MPDEPNTNSNPWAAHAAHNAEFSGESTAKQEDAIDGEPRSTKDILAGVNPDAMRAMVEESHRGLFGKDVSAPANQPPAPPQQPPSVPTPAPVSHAPQANPMERETITVPVAKARLLKQLAATLEETAQRIREVLSDVQELEHINTTTEAPDAEDSSADHIIEGVFNGSCMIGPDGKQYNVPANYASKSKLVEGDMLKLTILPSGKFIYKQIGPIERERLVGILALGTDKNEYYVEKDGRRWRILHASVTYYKGQPGDETIVLVPRHGESAWAAVENIVSRS